MDNINPLNPQAVGQPVSQTPAVAMPPVAAPAVTAPAVPVAAPISATPPAPVKPPVLPVTAPAVTTPPAPVAPLIKSTVPVNMLTSVATPAPTFQLASTQQKLTSTPIPASPANPTAPQSPQVAKQAIAGAGSLFKKVALALVIVVVFGSAVGLGYSLFPETFYNNFGKFVGLPAPAGMEEETVAVDDVVAENSDVQKASAPEVVIDAKAMMEMLPGADANFVAYFNATQASKDSAQKLIKELEKYFMPKTETAEPVAEEDDLSQILSQIETFVLVAKFEQVDAKNPDSLAETNPPAAAAIKVLKEEEAKLLEKLNSLKAPSDSQSQLANLTFEGDGNGVILAKSNADKLTGKASENSLSKTLLETKDVNFAFGMDVKSFVKAPAPSTTAPKPNSMDELAKAETLLLTGNFESSNDQYSFKVSAIASFADETTASDVLVKTLQPQLQKLESYIPENFKSFFVFNSSAQTKNITVNAEVKDLVLLTQKLIQARDNLQSSEIKKEGDLKDVTTQPVPAAPTDDEQVAPTPDTTEVTTPTDSSAPVTGVKVPRKKPAPAQ